MENKEGDYRTYLGDGVYAGFDGFHIILYANDPTTPTDIIYLEDNVFLALKDYAHKVWNIEEDEV